MKTTLTHLRTLLLVLIGTVISHLSQAQAPTCKLVIANDAQVSSTEYQFDVYLISAGSGSFELAGHQYGFNYNSAIKNGGTLTASWVSGSSQLGNPAQLQNTVNTTNNPSQIRLASPSPPGTGNGSSIAVGTVSPLSGGTRVGRLRMINSVPFAVLAPNVTISLTSSTSSTRTGVNAYVNATNLPLCIDGVTGNPSATCVGTVNMVNQLSNPVLNAPTCTAPSLSASVTNVACAGGSNGAIDLTITGGTPSPFTISWSNGASTEDLSGLSAGTYSVSVTTNDGACTATASYTVGGGAPLTSNTSSASACDSYTWSADGNTYTQSGSYTYVNGCNTEILNLTITPSTSNSSTASACDSYTWSVDGATYTQSGTYSSVSGCHTETLNLTITPSTSNSATASACDSYTWSVDGITYTQSGSYTSVSGCHTEILSLTITPSTSNSSSASACDSYSWGVNGQTYTQSGTYSSVSGCHTEILNLTITPSSSNTTTASACDSYTWSVTGQSYTQSGTYSSVDGCHTEILALTIVASGTNTSSAQACGSYTWSADGNTYTQSGVYTSVSGCATDILNLTITNVTASASAGSILCNGGTTSIVVSAADGTAPYTGTGTFTVGAGAYSYTVTDANGCTATVSGSVSEPAVLAASATAGTINCNSSTTDVTVSATGGTAPYTGTGVFTVSEGTYSYTVTDANGCTASASISVITTSNVGTPGAIAGTAQACVPGVAGSLSFSISAVPNATSYAWTVPAGFTITSGQGTSAITVSYTAAAVQSGIAGQLCVTASDACGTSPASCASISYQVAQPVTPPSISGPGKLCPGQSATFSIASVARATSYSWSVPANVSITSGQGSNIITVSVAAGYSGGTVAVSASNSCGTSPQRSKSVTTNLSGTPGAISGDAGGVCNAAGIVYSIASVTGATSYNWSVTGGTIVSGQGSTSITVNFGSFTNGSVSVQSLNGCGSSSLRTLTVKGSPAQPGVISGSKNVCAGTQQAYSVATVAGATNYAWVSTAAGTVLAQGSKNTTIQWNTAASNQAISVTASNACGSSPIRGLSGITVSTCARTTDAGAFTLSAFPNPTTGRVTVVFDAPENGDYRLSVIDLSGRTLMIEELDILSGVSQKDYDLSGYAAGMYFMVLENGNDIQKIRLVVE
ncbi:MAG: T9SS type A sorting domain-containing protein [Bacteroidota bacterium]